MSANTKKYLMKKLNSALTAHNFTQAKQIENLILDLERKEFETKVSIQKLLEEED